MDALFFGEIMRKCIKRKREFAEEADEFNDEARAKLRFNLIRRNQKEVDFLLHVALSNGTVILAGRRYVGPHQPNRKREKGESWQGDAYNNWDDEHFKDMFCIRRQVFNFILNAIYQFIVKKPNEYCPKSY